MSPKSPLNLLLIALLAMTLLLPGCAGKIGTQQTRVHYYPQCYQPIQQLREDNLREDNEVASRTSTSKAATNKLKAPKMEADLVLAEYDRVIDATTILREKAIRTMAATEEAARRYDQQFKQLINDYKRGAITAEERDKRYAEIRSGLQEISSILQEKYNDIADKDAEFEKALPTAAPAVKKKHKDLKNGLKAAQIEKDQVRISYDREIAASDVSRNKAA